MKDWLNLPWWQDKTPLEKETGQYVLIARGAGSGHSKRARMRTLIEKFRATSVAPKESCVQKPMPRGPLENLHQDEFGLRDALVGKPLDAVIACPLCGSPPIFDRKWSGASNSPFNYRVRCRWGSANFDDNPCKERTTPWLPRLALAVRHWTLSIKLAK